MGAVYRKTADLKTINSRAAVATTGAAQDAEIADGF